MNSRTDCSLRCEGLFYGHYVTQHIFNYRRSVRAEVCFPLNLKNTLFCCVISEVGLCNNFSVQEKITGDSLNIGLWSLKMK